MRAVLFHPLGVTLLAFGLLLAGALRFQPWAGSLSGTAPWVLFWGVVGYTASTAGLVWLRAGESESPHRRPSDADVSEAAVRKQLRLDALQHPTTLVPLAVALTSACYLVLLAPSTVDRLATMAALMLAVAAALGSFLWFYAFRHQERYATRMRWLTGMLEEARASAELAELEILRKRLDGGFLSLESARGARTFRGLEEEFSKLRPVLEVRREAAPLSIMQVPALAAETYHRGLSVLADALELIAAIHGPNKERLEAGIAELQREIESSNGDESQREMNWIREDTLASHRQRLAILDQLGLRADQLLHLAGRCEASLHRTRIEVAAIKAGGSENSVDSVVVALQETVRRAKEVQEELYRLGY